MHRLDQWLAVLLACQPTILGGLTADIGFNLVKRRDAQKSLPGQRCLRRGRTSWIFSLYEPAEGEPDTGVGGFPDQTAKAGVAIHLEKTAETPSDGGRMLGLPILAVDISGGRMTGAAPGPIIDRVAPSRPVFVFPRRDRAPAASCRRRTLWARPHGAQEPFHTAGVSHQQARPTQSHNVERSSVTP